MDQSWFDIGIDEAGYGPRLGPLCVGLAVLEGDSGGTCLPGKGPGTVQRLVRDSKQIFRGRGGLARLEGIALAALWWARGSLPRSLAELLDPLPPGFAEHPWYCKAALPLPLAASIEQVSRDRKTLEREFAGRRLVRAAVALLPTGPFNRQVERLANKALVEQELIAGLLVGQLAEGREGQVWCDRLGGRRYYAAWLRSCFPLRDLRVLEERLEASRYELLVGSARVGFAFLVRGEEKRLEIALASCLAKYHREVLMRLFNDFWRQRHPELRRTSGYPEDAARFLSSLAGDPLASSHVHMLVRSR